MASTTAAYRISGEQESAKERPAFSVAELEKFFETCPGELVPYRFLRLLHGMWIGSESRDGRRPFGAEIQLYGGTARFQRGCRYKSDRTVRYNIPAAVQRGFLEIAYCDERGNTHHIWIRRRSEHARGEYRRVTTYRLPVSLLLQWREWQRGKQHHADVTPIRKPTQPAPDPTPDPPSKSAPVKKTAAEHHRSTRRIDRDARKALFNAYIALKRSGMPHAKALAEVVRQFKDKFSPDDVEFALKIQGHKDGQDVTEEAVAEAREIQCTTCNDERVLVNPKQGPGEKRLIPCPKCWSGG